MSIGDGLARLPGYRFEVRYSAGALSRAVAAADVADSAYAYFNGLFAGVEPDIAVIVADEADWESSTPYGLPYFNDDAGQLRPGVVVMPAGSGDFWTGIAEDIHRASPDRYGQLTVAYPDGNGGVDLQPFFDLITVHELAHAFETLGDLRLPTAWLSEIFVNLALHAFVSTRQPASLPTLETLPVVGAGSRALADRMRGEGYSTLEDLEAHYPGGDEPMDGLNYVWFQYRWMRLAADLFEADGEQGLRLFWNCFHARDRELAGDTTAKSLAPLLGADISPSLGHEIHEWR